MVSTSSILELRIKESSKSEKPCSPKHLTGSPQIPSKFPCLPHLSSLSVAFKLFFVVGKAVIRFLEVLALCKWQLYVWIKGSRDAVCVKLGKQNVQTLVSILSHNRFFHSSMQRGPHKRINSSTVLIKFNTENLFNIY